MDNKPEADDPVKEKCLFHQYQEMDLDSLKNLLTHEDVSKNQKKKIMKQIQWFESADLRKEKRKKKKLRYKEMRLKNTDQSLPKRVKLEKISTLEDFELHHHIAIDLSFEKLMVNKDLRKLGKQIAWCYKVNRRSKNPVQYHLCGLESRLTTALDPSHVNWDLHFDKELYKNTYSEKVVYLTAESPNVLQEVQPGKVYVIGGLVDHNHQKGVCQNLAESKGVQTARLPLQENIDIKTRKVLTINHVFEMLLAYIETKDWKEAILKVLPAKKLNSTNSPVDPCSDNDAQAETDPVKSAGDVVTQVASRTSSENSSKELISNAQQS